jgi:hypothetical protein
VTFYCFDAAMCPGIEDRGDRREQRVHKEGKDWNLEGAFFTGSDKTI